MRLKNKRNEILNWNKNCKNYREWEWDQRKIGGLKSIFSHKLEISMQFFYFFSLVPSILLVSFDYKVRLYFNKLISNQVLKSDKYFIILGKENGWSTHKTPKIVYKTM